MNAHARFSRIATLLMLLVLTASGLRLPAATSRVQAMPVQDPLAAPAHATSHAPVAATSASAWISQGPSPAFTRGTLGQDLVHIPPESEPVVGSLGGAPYSGGHNQIVAHPTDPNTIYVGADGGIWKTTNALSASPTWTSLIEDKPSLVINGLSADPTDPTFQTLLAGTDRAGLYYTTNGGTSWTQIINPTIVPSGYSDGYRAVIARGNTMLVTVARERNAFSPQSGLYRTTGGVAGTWTKISGTGGLPNAPADGLVGDPNNPNRLYVMFRGASGGIFRSDDLGATWTNISSGITIFSDKTDYFDAAVFNNGTINAVTVTLNGTAANTVPIASATQSGTTATVTTTVAHLFSAGQSVTVAGASVAGYNGTFTITSVPSSTTFTYTTAASGLPSAASGGTATSNITVKRLFRSVNGAAFTPLDTPIGNFSYISADKINPNLVYVGGYEYTAARVDASRPSGSQVTQLSNVGSTTLSAAATSTATTVTVAATTGMPTPPFVATIDSEQVSVTAISNKTLTVVRGVNGTTATAHSNGATVIGYNYGLLHADFVAFTFDANGSLLAGSHGGLYRLPDPRSPPSATANYWVSIMGNIGAFQFDGIAYDNLFNVLLGGAQDNGAPRQLAAGSMNWAHGPGGDGGDVLADNRNYAALGQSAEYRSAQSLAGFKRRIYSAPDGLVSVTDINTSVITDKRFFTPLAQNAVDPQRFLLGGADHLYETLDQFATIVSAASVKVGGRGLAYGGYRNGVANPDVFYFSLSGGFRIYSRTTAGGAVTASAALPSGAGVITYLAMDPNDWMRVFVVDEKSQVYMTTNGGSSWSNITGNLKTTAGSVGQARTVAIVPGAAGYLVVGSDSGVFAAPLSSLGASTPWSRLGTGMPNMRVGEIVYDATDDVLVMGTYARGAFTLPNASREFNTAPTVALSGPTTAAEGTTASYAFTVSDANLGDTFTVDSLTVSAGGTLVAGSLITTTLGGSFQVSYPDGPASPSISLVVQDSYAEPSTTATRAVTVTNVAPTAAILGAPSSGAVGTAISMGSSVTDPSAADTSAGFSLAWSVTRNGSPFASGSGAGFSFTPNAAATYVVTLTATDKDGGVGSAAATITIASSNLTANTFSVTVDEGGTTTNSGTYTHDGPAPVSLSASAGTLVQTQRRTLFGDTFDSEPLSLSGPVTTLTQWNVTQGNVDVTGPGNHDIYPGHGHYLDMTGTANGTIESKTTFTLTPGVYQLSFKLGTNLEGPTNNSLRVTLGSVFDQSFAAPAALTDVVRQITVSTAVSVPLRFAETGPVDNYGSILDDVRLVWLDAPVGQPNALNVLGYWQLGEDDVGAANGLTSNSTTLGRDANGLNPALNLTRNGSPTYTSAVAANSGSVLGMSFAAGLSDSYTRNNPVTTATDNFGIEARVKVNAGSADSTIAANGNGNSAGFGLRVRNGTYQGRYDGIRFIDSGIPLVIDQWKHVALVRDNGITKIYLDGALVHSDSLAGPNPAAGIVGIGFVSTGSVQVDDVRVFTFAPGTFNPQDLAINTSAFGTWSWSYTTNDGTDQPQEVTITASTGVSGETTSLPFTLLVNNVAPTASLSNGGAVSEGSSGSVSFSGQSDPSTVDTAAGFHYAYDFDNDGSFEIGDGTYAGSVTAASATVPASFLADDSGAHTVRGRIIDKDDGATDYTTTITINNAAPTTAVSGPAAALVGQRVTFVLQASDSSPIDQAAGFTYSITWGDGSPVQTVNPVVGTGDATATHAYAATGSYTVQVTATDKDGATGSVANTAITVNALTTSSLQALIATTPTVYLLPTSDAILHDQVNTINGLASPAAPVDITILLGAGPYSGVTLSPPDGITLALAGTDTNDTTGTQITGASPAVTVTQGNAFVQGALLTTATDSPTVLVTGGNLTLSQNWIDESTGFNDAAIEVTGGHVDYGFDVTTNINGEGGFFRIPDRRAVGFPEGIDDFMIPNMFAQNGVMLPTSHRSATSLVSAPATASTFGQPVTFTAYVDTNVEELGSATGTVKFYDGATLLATVPLQTSGGLTTATYTSSSLSVGAHTIEAFYSGDDLFVASSTALTHQVGAYPFAGFFQPVDNPPTFNQVTAGAGIPFKFSLSGNRGLGIIAAGYPTSQQIQCDSGAPIDDIEQTTTSPSGLTYDASSDQYTYVWRTVSSWAGTCRQFTLRLADGTDHLARFSFR